MSATVFFGLLSAITWGAGDFCGGLASRRASIFAVVIWGQVVGALVLLCCALLFGEPFPPVSRLGWGALAGIAGDIGLFSLYWSLANGRMGVAAPVSGVVGAATPVLAGALLEGVPGALQVAGFGLALVGIWLVARTDSSAVRINELGLPVLAGVGFGLFYILIHQVSDQSLFWPLIAARVASIVLLVAVAKLLRRPVLPTAGQLPLIALAGALDAGGNIFFALAAQVGRLDVAGVTSSLYPAATVTLAWLVLKERLSRPQTLGVATTLVAIALIVL